MIAWYTHTLEKREDGAWHSFRSIWRARAFASIRYFDYAIQSQIIILDFYIARETGRNCTSTSCKHLKTVQMVHLHLSLCYILHPLYYHLNRALVQAKAFKLRMCQPRPDCFLLAFILLQLLSFEYCAVCLPFHGHGSWAAHGQRDVCRSIKMAREKV